MSKRIETAVWDQLKQVIDPELNIDIVALGLIYDVEIGESEGQPTVYIRMTLTTPGCPLAGVFDQMVKDQVVEVAGVRREHIEVELTFDPPWIPDMMTEEARAELGF
jgi:metal-sulfur cluster biosynthetic enzyme